MTSGGEETNADDKGSASAFILSSETRETFRGVRRTEPATSTLFSTIMINTYNNSLPPPPPVPPPVPPRGSRQQPQPGAADSKGQVKGLYILIFLQFLVTSGMFFYLFWSNNRAGDMREEAAAMKMLQDCGKGSLGHQSVLDCLKISQSEGEGEAHSSDGQLSASGAAAHMKVEKPSPLSALKELQWDQKESIVRDVVHLYGRGMLQIGQSGYYYIYSQVTFSKTHPKTPLVQTVMSWSGSSGKEEGSLLMKAFCYKSSVEQCTSFQGGVFKLEKGQKVSVNVTDKDLVHFDGTATAFGLFQLLRMP
ncbi:CD40 ligand-like isoform X2 [Brienomyrus brachyistius]|uniref:CD40 ligand-like isoform X2 n=1 Tax=Brienomyrus brachyistius TaxID=42636 RepID=UPI0020B1A4AD|nr:CD40 ligand-like isoform X2 [Brienomyrus brachyistius]